MAETIKSGGGLRALTRETVRARIAADALALFYANGFDATTMDDIAQHVGVSTRSLFRYFPTKEDVVIADLLANGTALRDRVEHYLDTLTPWWAIHAAMRERAAALDVEPDKWLTLLKVINDSPALRARNLEKHLTWSDLLIPVIIARGEVTDAAARTVVTAAFACQDVTLTIWSDLQGTTPIVDVLDATFQDLRRATA